MTEALDNIFPENITVAECRAAIRGAPGFREARKGDYILFNYDFAFSGSFPDPNLAPTPEEKRLLQIRRECRGIIFHKDTEEILNRRYHKFFNINELDETKEHKINMDRPHVVMDKMDGCLVSAFVSQGQTRFGSKMGVTEVGSVLESEFLPSCGIEYVPFSEEWIEKGFTPLYEWCSYKQQIVVEYDKDMLILTGLRNNATGRYLTYKELCDAADKYRIPVTKILEEDYSKDYDSAGQLLNKVKEAVGLEGYVLMFDNGEMYKMKCQWYIDRSKKMAGSFTGQEKELWNIILDQKIDDLAEALGEKRKAKLEEYGLKLWQALERSADAMAAIVDDAKARGLDRREFANEMQERAAAESEPLVVKDLLQPFYRIFEGHKALGEVVEFVKRNVNNKTRLDRARHLVAEGIKINLS